MPKKTKQSTKKSNDEKTSAELQQTKHQINVNAGRKFYEKATSRRSRHRDALQLSQNASSAVALGMSKKRKAGPNQTCTVRPVLTGSFGEYETCTKKRTSWNTVKDLHAEKDQEILEGLMHSGNSLAMKAIERGASRELRKGNSDRSFKNNDGQEKKSEFQQRVAKHRMHERQKQQRQERKMNSPMKFKSPARGVVGQRNIVHQGSKTAVSDLNITARSSIKGDETMKIQTKSNKSADEVIDLLSSDSSDDGGIDI